MKYLGPCLVYNTCSTNIIRYNKISKLKRIINVYSVIACVVPRSLQKVSGKDTRSVLPLVPSILSALWIEKFKQ